MKKLKIGKSKSSKSDDLHVHDDTNTIDDCMPSSSTDRDSNAVDECLPLTDHEVTREDVVDYSSEDERVSHFLPFSLAMACSSHLISDITEFGVGERWLHFYSSDDLDSDSDSDEFKSTIVPDIAAERERFWIVIARFIDYYLPIMKFVL